MSGGEALDLALGLLRAPARRALLVARPLPSGVTTLLEVAGGSPAAADAAAASLGADPAELLEASRFFVQQILLAEGADAYRIMGVDREADIARIRDHHRLLLRWLHPDRSQGEQWESALATRVNQAWNQLRSPAARAAYDSRSPGQRLQPAAFADAEAAMPPMPPLAPLPRVPMNTASARKPGVGALGMAALAVACIGLGWLAFRGVSEPATPEFLRLTAASVPAPAPSSARAGTGAESAEAQPAATAKPPADSGAAAVASFVAAAAAAAPTPAPTSASAATPAPATVLAGHSAGPAAGLGVGPIAVADASSERPAPLARAPTASRSPQPATVATSEASAPAPIAIAPAPVAASTRVADEAPLQPEFPSAIPHHPPPAPPPLSAPVTAATADAADPLLLFESANAMVDALFGWLVSSHDAQQPAYAGPPARLEAVDERLRLHDRHGSSGRLSLEQRDWRLGAQHATVAARYRVTSRGSGRETGSAHIALARSGSQWQLVSLSLVADP